MRDPHARCLAKRTYAVLRKVGDTTDAIGINVNTYTA